MVADGGVTPALGRSLLGSVRTTTRQYTFISVGKMHTSKIKNNKKNASEYLGKEVKYFLGTRPWVRPPLPQKETVIIIQHVYCMMPGKDMSQL